MKYLKKINSAEEAVQEEYNVVYNTYTEVIIKSKSNGNPLTRWYNGDEIIKEMDIVGELTSSLKEANCTRCEVGTNVTSIGQSAMSWCFNLTSVTIPDSVTTIGSSAFDYDYQLSNISIGKNVTSIGTGAFYNCTSLISIKLPKSITTIEAQAFYNCTNLTSVTYNGTIEQWNGITKGNYWKLNVPITCVVHCTDGGIPIADA